MSQQLLLGMRLRPSSIFASYVAGTNQAIVDMLRALAPGVLPPCVYLQGAAGTGKSHLLQAICADAANRGLAAAYLPLAEIASMGAQMLSGWGALDIVCIDDVERIASEPDWNRELFALHQQLEEKRGRLVVASKLAPAALRMTLRDLASRLAGGWVLTLQPPSEAGQVSALKLHAQLRGFELPDETAAFMLRRLPRDMTTLCRFLAELDDASLVAQRRLTVKFVTEVLKSK